MSTLHLYEYCHTDKPKQLVLLLHGYGANGENLINLAYEFKHALPDAHFIAPNAIEPWEGGFPHAYQWFSLSSGFARKNIEEMAHNIKTSHQVLGNIIDQQLQRFNLETKDLFLVGFSQGAMMALYQSFIRQQKIAGVIAFSGKLILPEMLGEKTLSKPEICLIHGESDSIVPFENFLEAQKILKENNFTFESHPIAHLDHSIDLHGVRLARSFLENSLKKIRNS